MKERIKELTCLYAISNLNEHELSVEELLQSAVECLPEAMHCSEYSAASIEFNGKKFCTSSFKPARWMLTARNETIQNHHLTIRIAYLGKNTGHSASPFLKEEEEMTRSVACQLSLKIDRIFSKNENQRKQRLLDQSYQLSGIGIWELNVQKSMIYFSPFIKKLYGIEPDINPDLKAAFQLVKEGKSREKIKRAIYGSMDSGESFDIEVELITATGAAMWVRMVGEAEFEGERCSRLYGTLQNIQKKKKTELQLKNSRKKLQKIMNQSPDVICTADADGRFVEVSEKSKPAWGYKPGEMVGERFIDYVLKEDVEKTEKALREIVAGREMNNFENCYVHKKGFAVPLVWSIKWDEQDRLMYCVARDGTEKKRAEQELKDRNRFIETTLENLSIGIAVNRTDDGKVQLMNKKFSEIYGWPEEELTDVDRFFEKVYPDEKYRSRIKARVLEDIESGDMKRMAWDGMTITTKSGEKKIIRAKNIPIYDQNLMISTVIDITQQKKAEKQLLENEKRFKALVQEGSDLLAIFDEEGIYKYVSPTSENILGIKAEHFLGKNLLQYVHDRDKSKLTRVIQNLPELKRFKLPPIRFRDVNYKWRWLETTITNMTNEPAVGGYVANSRDITERMTQKEKLEESLEEKEVLLAEIHHRVKNNLAIVSGILQLQAYDEDNKEVIERLYDSIFRIQTMASIHELLYQNDSFSRLMFSEIIEKLIYDIDKTLRGAMRVDVEINKDQHELNISQAIPCSLIINEVVTNIYKHAFEGRDQGLILIKLQEENDHLFLMIRDDGVGFPEGFDAKESATLGLNIIRILSTQLEAEYNIESTVEGTVFEMKFQKRKGTETTDLYGNK